jgi:hypothetical protein
VNHTIPLPFDSDGGLSGGQGAPPRAAIALPPPEGWPKQPAACAFHGLPGEIVAEISPHTEADPVAILSQLLVAFGAGVGRGAHFQVEATRHHPNEFLLLVGESAKARKGSSWEHVRRLLCGADPTIAGRILTGLSSGEGLIWALRDPAGTDPGCPDRRALVVESEFAGALKAGGREISTLSPTLRCAWDGRPLALLTRTAPARATDAHVSVIGHITAEELRRHATTIELSNGFLNRFVLVACRRVALLPEGGDEHPLDARAQRALGRNLAKASRAGQVRLSPQARELWWELYARLAAENETGTAGALQARAEAHLIRLALIYALADGGRQIAPEHLQAALALWDYAAASARWVFNKHTGDPLAEEIHAALTRSPQGLTRTQIRDLHQRNLPAERVEQALAALAAAGRATRTLTPTTGRPAEVWNAAAAEHAPPR